MMKKSLNLILEEFLIRLLRYHRRNNPVSLKYISNDWIGTNVMVKNVYEKHSFIGLFEYLSNKKNDYRFIDIGANIGNHSVLASKYFNQVVSFEPNPHLYNLLSLNTLGLANIQINNWGIGLYNDSTLLYLQDDNFGTGSLIGSTLNGKGSTVPVNLRTADESFKLADFDIIKIDVEGYEKVVLDSIFNNIETIPNVIVIVELDRPENNLEIHQKLSNLGFEKCYIVNNGFFHRYAFKSFSLSALKFKWNMKYEAVIYSKYDLI